jgi:hypothetical protein
MDIGINIVQEEMIECFCSGIVRDPLSQVRRENHEVFISMVIHCYGTRFCFKIPYSASKMDRITCSEYTRSTETLSSQTIKINSTSYCTQMSISPGAPLHRASAFLSPGESVTLLELTLQKYLVV